MVGSGVADGATERVVVGVYLDFQYILQGKHDALADPSLDLDGRFKRGIALYKQIN